MLHYMEGQPLQWKDLEEGHTLAEVSSELGWPLLRQIYPMSARLWLTAACASYSGIMLVDWSAGCDIATLISEPGIPASAMWCAAQQPSAAQDDCNCDHWHVMRLHEHQARRFDALGRHHLAAQVPVTCPGTVAAGTRVQGQHEQYKQPGAQPAAVGQRGVHTGQRPPGRAHAPGILQSAGALVQHTAARLSPAL